MGQQVTGSTLAFLGLALYGFVALDWIGYYKTGGESIFIGYGILIVFLGAGIYAGEIQLEQESAWKYEGLILFYAIVVILIMVGVVVISVA